MSNHDSEKNRTLLPHPVVLTTPQTEQVAGGHTVMPVVPPDPSGDGSSYGGIGGGGGGSGSSGVTGGSGTGRNGGSPGPYHHPVMPLQPPGQYIP
jgi:hypothetical protein